MSATSLDILAFGEPMFEFNHTGEGRQWLGGFGGDTSNAAIAAARLGARVGYFTGLGDDAFGKDFLRLKLDRNAKSYWIDRSPPGPPPQSMKNQF